MNFFVKPYLYTDKEIKTDYLKNRIKNYMYNVEFKGLKMGMNEYFSLPLHISSVVDDTLTEIHKLKNQQLKKLNSTQKGRSRNGFR